MQSRRKPAAIERDSSQQKAIHVLGFTRTAFDTDDGDPPVIVLAASEFAWRASANA
jgi:hypothetical protein